MRKSISSPKSRLARAGLAAGAATALLLAATASPAFAASLVLTLSQTSGPSGGLNTITATAATATATTAPFGTTVTPWVQFQTKGTATACAVTWIAVVTPFVVGTSTLPALPVQTAGSVAVPAGDVKKITSVKLAITVPAGVVLTANGAGTVPAKVDYNICVYSGNTPGAVGTGSPLIANGAYSIAGRPVITGLDPDSGPALGDTQITISGSGFATGTNGTTGTVGGVALKSIVVASNGQSLTAITPAHTAGDDFVIALTSTGGRVSSDDPDNLDNGGTTYLYDFSNGLEIAPNTAKAGSTVDVDIMGVGFLDMTFTAADPSTGADGHIYLVDGVYDPTDALGVKAVGPIAECVGVLVINDNEVICTLILTGSLDAAGGAVPATPVPNGAYTVAVVSNGAVDANDGTDTTYQKSEITSTATFTVAPY